MPDDDERTAAHGTRSATNRSHRRRESAGAEPRLAIEMRHGRPGPSLAEALARLPGYALIGRRYRRISG